MKNEWKKSIIEHYDSLGYRYFHGKRNHYFEELIRLVNSEIMSGGVQETLFDLACGTGNLLHSIARKNEFLSLGADLSGGLVSIAHKEAKNQGCKNVHFIIADCEYLPIRENTLEFVTCIDALEHFQNLEPVLLEIRRALHKSGIFLITTPSSRWGLLLEIAEHLGMKLPEGPHTWRGEKDIKNLLNRYNLRLIKKYGRLIFPFRIPIITDLTELIEKWRFIANSFGLIQVYISKKD